MRLYEIFLYIYKNFINMKKTVFILLTVLLAACSETREQKAQGLVKEYLNKNLNDPKSYESVSWGTLDSSFTTYEEIAAIDIAMQSKAAERAVDELKNGDPEIGEMYKKDYDSLTKRLDSIKLAYKPTFNCLMLKHKYRAKNAMGAVILEEKTFFIADDFSKVIYTK